MTGTPNDLDTTRHEPPPGTADIFISPGESNRNSVNGRKRKIGRILTESFLAAAVGGIITFMVWQQVSPTQTPNAESKVALEANNTEIQFDELTQAKAEIKPETLAQVQSEAKPEVKPEAKPETTAQFATMDDFMVEPTPVAKSADSLEAEQNAMEIPKESSAVADQFIAESHPANLDQSADDAIDDTLDNPADDNLLDALDEPADNPSDPTIAKINSEPKTGNKATTHSVNAHDLYNVPVIKASAKEDAGTKKKYISLAPIESKNTFKPVQEAKVEAKVEPKVESKVISITKAEPKVAPIALPTIDAKIAIKDQAEAKIAAPIEPKAEPRLMAKVEPKVEAKTETKAEPKLIAKAETKVEAKTEPKLVAEAKADSKIEAKAEPKLIAKAETKAEAKAEPKVVAKAETKTEAKAEPKLVAKSDAKTETKAEAKTDAKTEPKLVAKAETKTDTKVETATEATPIPAAKIQFGFPQTQSDGQFLVTAGSFSSIQSAETLQKKLQEAGIPIRLRKSQLNNKAIYHLLTGPFATTEMATRAVMAIKERTGIESRYLTMRAPNPKSSESRQAVASKQPVAASSGSAIKKPVKSDAANHANESDKKVSAKPHTGHFVATAGSFSNPVNATQLRHRIEKQGVAAYTKTAKVNGKEFTHVILGPFTSQKEADKSLETIQKEIGVMAKATQVQ